MDLRERGSGTDRHPWELARSRFFRTLIADHVDLAGVRTVFDIGAGDGWFAGELASELPADAVITCWDVNYRSADLDAPTDSRVVRTSIAPVGPFDLVLALDVLEHLDDAERFVAETVEPRVGGMLVVSVPAHPWLFADHDRMLGHRRRYRRTELRDLLGRHVTIRASGGLFTSLVAPRTAAVLAERLGWSSAPKGVGGWSHGPRLTKWVTAILDGDAAIGRRLADRGIPLPGLSLWALGEVHRP